MSKCTYCDGEGWTAEHDTHPHVRGCEGACPVQVQCYYCEGTGEVLPHQKGKDNE